MFSKTLSAAAAATLIAGFASADDLDMSFHGGGFNGAAISGAATSSGTNGWDRTRIQAAAGSAVYQSFDVRLSEYDRSNKRGPLTEMDGAGIEITSVVVAEGFADVIDSGNKANGFGNAGFIGAAGAAWLFEGDGDINF